MGNGSNRVHYGKWLQQTSLWKFLTLGMYGISAEVRAAARRCEYGVISMGFLVACEHAIGNMEMLEVMAYACIWRCW